MQLRAKLTTRLTVEFALCLHGFTSFNGVGKQRKQYVLKFLKRNDTKPLKIAGLLKQKVHSIRSKFDDFLLVSAGIT